MDLNIKNKVVIVTGGSQGIGKGIVNVLMNEGVNVIIFDKKEPSMNVEYISTDVSKKEEVIKGIDYIITKYGRIDAIVNNAGIEIYGSVHETSEEDWDKIINVNVKGPFLMSKYSIPYMLKQGKGVIVNVASIQAFATQRRVAAYTTSKHALLGLTRSIAVDYAPIIRAVAICPGSIRTPLLEWAAEEEVGKEHIEEKIREWGEAYPMRRVGEPEEIGYLTAFLISDLASFINGVCVTIDGGLTALIPLSSPKK
ncbi:aldose dehydrogenase [Sulfolobus sp. A20]|uniref:SDR family oxidoreductase n=1 Tax=Sulfolobaceae TaxID=118883 RepID=UPI000845F9E4|nr:MULTISPECIES: SDR family oxidoreductase [unclassified Sulfolobus]TRM73831.1 KR domain-containing protein [Sulfolobus sp. E5]TRM74081.1 KR domain-containing protein [Sulfolobus sp. A20-N-F8]TRM74754.1 KR domain-containing protein [Sulfolobus sp. B5]TRM86489.1 KR domain-containing protein [Sulfolobus sp. C3]TRM97388.1 KR domain-containing protein [Sulfolobus sp. F1]